MSSSSAPAMLTIQINKYYISYSFSVILTALEEMWKHIAFLPHQATRHNRHPKSFLIATEINGRMKTHWNVVERTGSSQVGDPHVSDRMWTGTRSSSVVLQSSLIACKRIKSCSEGKFDQKEHDQLRFSNRDDRGRNSDSVNVVLPLALLFPDSSCC